MYCLTIRCHPLWFWMVDKLCQPAIWYHVVNASTQYIVNPPTVWPFNIHMVLCTLPACNDIMWWMHLHSTQSTLLLSNHSISSSWFGKNALCQPVTWYHGVNATTQYTVNPPTIYPFNIILMVWKECTLPACNTISCGKCTDPPQLRRRFYGQIFYDDTQLKQSSGSKNGWPTTGKCTGKSESDRLLRDRQPRFFIKKHMQQHTWFNFNWFYNFRCTICEIICVDFSIFPENCWGDKKLH